MVVVKPEIGRYKQLPIRSDISGSDVVCLSFLYFFVLMQIFPVSLLEKVFEYMGHRTKRFFQWSGKMGERF